MPAFWLGFSNIVWFVLSFDLCFCWLFITFIEEIAKSDVWLYFIQGTFKGSKYHIVWMKTKKSKFHMVQNEILNRFMMFKDWCTEEGSVHDSQNRFLSNLYPRETGYITLLKYELWHCVQNWTLATVQGKMPLYFQSAHK